MRETLCFGKYLLGSVFDIEPLFVVETGTNERFSFSNNGLPPYATENQWECIRNSEKCFKDK